ncbi:f-box protein, partial [Quercus suber]
MKESDIYIDIGYYFKKESGHPVLSTIINHCVRRVWNSVTDELVVESFKAKWKLKHVIGKPISGTFWRDNESRKFAISHQ